MKIKFLLILLVCTSILWSGCTLQTTPSGSTTEQTAVSDTAALPYYDVIKVIDGDTIKIDYNGTPQTVRLLQVDTPEANHPDPEKNVPMGKVATEFTRKMIGKKQVQIAFDKEEKDKYDRLLCYVYVDGKSVNEELLRSGMAIVLEKKPNISKTEEYKAIQEEARKQNLGIWEDIKANFPQKNISDEYLENSSEKKDSSHSSHPNQKKDRKKGDTSRPKKPKKK